MLGRHGTGGITRPATGGAEEARIMTVFTILVRRAIGWLHGAVLRPDYPQADGDSPASGRHRRG